MHGKSNLKTFFASTFFVAPFYYNHTKKRLFGYGTGWLIELCFDSFTGQTLWHQLIISGHIKHRLLRLEYSFISKAIPPPFFVHTLISKNMPCVSRPYPPPHPYPPLPIHITLSPSISPISHSIYIIVGTGVQALPLKNLCHLLQTISQILSDIVRCPTAIRYFISKLLSLDNMLKLSYVADSDTISKK